VFEDDELNQRSSLFSFSFSSLGSTKLLLGGTIVVVLATFTDLTPLIGAVTSQIRQTSDDGNVGDDGKYHGRYPNSLLTLFYPFTLLRDVVLDQPVNRTDVPFFWHVHVSVSYFLLHKTRYLQCCLFNDNVYVSG
jgi:hypothetical protein